MHMCTCTLLNSQGHLSGPGPGLDNAFSVPVPLHTHTHTQAFPWIPRVGKGLSWNLGFAGILNPLSQKQPFTPQPPITPSTFLRPVSYLCRAAVAQKIQIYICSWLAQVCPQPIPAHKCGQSTCMPCTLCMLSKHIPHFSSPMSASSIVPFKILCRDCFLLFSKGQDMVRQSTLWPLCLPCRPLLRDPPLFPLLSRTCLPAYLPSVPGRHLKALPTCSEETTNRCTIQR